MIEQIRNLNIQKDVLALRLENKILREELESRTSQLNKARNIVHRLLVVIQKHKWWSYEVIDEARRFMSEADKCQNKPL